MSRVHAKAQAPQSLRMLLAMMSAVLLAGAVLAGSGPAKARDDLLPAVAETAASAPEAIGAEVDAATPAAALDKQRVDAWLDGLVPYLMSEGDLAGAVVTIVADGKVLTERGFGDADVAAATPVDPRTTLFRPGSVSKMFVWTSVMQLVEQGKLDLDADINTWLDFQVPAKGAPITLRQIMTHTSGLEERLRHLIVLGPEHASNGDNFRKDFVPAQIFKPGTRPAYSNYATGIAEYIVERVSGLPFDAYAEQHIFEPLGMQYASFSQQLPADLAAHAAKGYRLASGQSHEAEKVPSPGVGGLYVSGAAMSRFMLAHLNKGELDGRRILAEQTARQMYTPQKAVLEPLMPMALGWLTSDTGGYPVISHGGTSLFFYSWMYLLPEQGIGLYVSTNSAGRNGAGAALRSQVFERFVETFLPVREITVAGAGVDEATAATQAAALAAVDWRSTRRSQNSFLKVLDLLSPTRVRRNDDGTISVDGMKGRNGALLRWRQVATWMWQEVDGRARLAAQVENGRPVYFSAEPLASIAGYEPIPVARSPRWLVPALLASVLVLLATVVLRVGGVVARRLYGDTRPRAGGPLRWVQNGAVLVLLAGFGGWLAYLQSRSAPGAILDPSLSGLMAMRALAWLVLLAAAALPFVAIRQPAAWPRSSRIWSWLLVVAGVVIAWTALAHGLAQFSLHY